MRKNQKNFKTQQLMIHEPKKERESRCWWTLHG
jgi:hypothetical protein